MGPHKHRGFTILAPKAISGPAFRRGTMISFYRIKHWYPQSYLKRPHCLPILMSEERIEYDKVNTLTLAAAPSVTGVTP